ncbi:MAG: WxPxxD family membrane protein [Anaerostipes sp.]|nr:WxPxxD family membrane protein [Anaerostipes sp.]
MQRRLVKALFCTGVLFVINALSSYMPLINNLYNKGFIKEVQLNENFITGDYHSIMSYGVVGIFIYIFFITYVQEVDKNYEMVRYKNRKQYTSNSMKRAIIATTLFALIYQIVGIVCVVIWGNVSILLQHKWIQGIMVQMLATILYYMWIYMIYIVFCSVLTKGFSKIIIVGISMASYSIMSIFFQNQWFFMKDIDLIRGICTEETSYLNSFIAIFRLSMVNLVFANIVYKIKEKEDIYEKK